MIAKLTLGAVAYFVLAKASMWLFTAQPDNIALLWLPAGLALYLYSRHGLPALAAVFAASFAANFAGMANDSLGHQVLYTLSVAGADTLFAWLSGTLLLRHLPDGVNKPLDLFVFILYCGLIPIAISTTIIGASLWWGGYLSMAQAQVTGFGIFFADLLGLLLVYPLFPAWERRHSEAADVSPIWYVASLASVAAIVASFYVAPWLRYLALPALVYVVIGAKSLYAYSSLSLSMLLYSLLSVYYVEVGSISDEWLNILALSCSITIAMLAMAIQQRSLLTEQSLRQQWMISATHDALTGLPNRANISFLIRHEIDRLKRDGGTFTLAMLDIDHFKRVNDDHGHAAGDKVLVELARRLRTSFRASDVVSRYGGEEFLILLVDTPIRHAHRLIDGIRQRAAAEPFDVGEWNLTLTFSAGLAEYQPADGDNFTQLVNLADQRLYRAKREGRNQVVSGEAVTGDSGAPASNPH